MYNLVFHHRLCFRINAKLIIPLYSKLSLHPSANAESKWGPALLDWKSVHAKMSWGVLLLLGGGFALSEVCKVSGLSESIGSSLLIMKDLPGPLIVLIVVLCVAGMTELMSNTATSSLLLPILADLVSEYLPLRNELYFQTF